jgi:hypothetical protein
MAYQITPKTVFRGGFGVAYTGSAQYNLGGGAISATDPIGPAGSAGLPIMTLAGGVPLTQAQIAWPNFNPGFYPVNGIIPGAGPAQLYDPNAGRPARQYQWSVGIQREIFRNLLVEGSYIGNRGIWWTNNSLVNYNYLSTAILNQYGLSLNNPADIAILSAPLNSPAAGPFMNKVPFAGFPVTATVAQSLRPFPQFSSGLSGLASPLGDTWYDSLQTKVTKRYSHGLDFTFAFTWSKSIDNFVGTPDLQNRELAKSLSYQDQPFVGRVGFSYILPRWGHNKALSFVVRDWTFTGFFNYASGLPIPPPAANAFPTINQLTFEGGAVATGSAGTTIGNTEIRVPGVPLFTKNLNCHCFDPNKTFVLNPAAWVNPALGQFGASPYYTDYRYQRRPGENMSIGRQFRIRESMILSVRAEFQNLFNRTEVNNPTVTNPQAPQTVSSAGLTTGGFGYINNTSLAVPPRTGTLVARFQF